MILIIGGFCQGKTEYVKSLPEYVNMTAGAPPLRFADGKTDSPELVETCPVILGFHHYIRRLADEKQVQTLIDHMITKNPDAIITMDEVGSGIVPMDPVDREYREMVGRAGQRLAGEAEQVHRVICGIGARIK